MRDETTRGSDHIGMATDPHSFAHWPDGLLDELKGNFDNGGVGSLLVSETDRVRVWHLRLGPGQRCAFHRHVNPYFWTAITSGRARNYAASGKITDVEYTEGETRHFHYGPGEYMIHSLENIGDDELAFVTVEFLDGTNPPLPVPETVRR